MELRGRLDALVAQGERQCAASDIVVELAERALRLAQMLHRGLLPGKALVSKQLRDRLDGIVQLLVQQPQPMPFPRTHVAQLARLLEQLLLPFPDFFRTISADREGAPLRCRLVPLCAPRSALDPA